MKQKILKTFLFSFLLFSIFFMKDLAINTYAEGHNHTSDCYDASLQHFCTGDSKNGGGCYNLPLTHAHDLSCYNKQCSNEIADFTGRGSEDGNTCSLCGWGTLKHEFTCNLCGATTTIHSCSNLNCSEYKESSEIENERNGIIQHGELPNIYIESRGKLTCTLEEGAILEYHKSCGKEDGKYYNEDGSLATPECGTVVVSWKPEIEQQTEKNQSTKVVVTYMDGHTSTIPSTYTTFDSIDKTAFVENYPIQLYFQVKTSVGGGLTEQSVTAYYTNTSGVKENEIENKKDDMENIVGEVEQEVKPADKLKDNITPSVKPTKIPNTTNENKDNNIVIDKENQSANENLNKEEDVDKNNIDIENQEDINETIGELQNDNNEEKNETILLVTIVIIVLLITTFIIINVVINNKNK